MAASITAASLISAAAAVVVLQQAAVKHYGRWSGARVQNQALNDAQNAVLAKPAAVLHDRVRHFFTRALQVPPLRIQERDPVLGGYLSGLIDGDEFYTWHGGTSRLEGSVNDG